MKETTFPFSEGNNGMRKYNFSLNVDIGKEAPKKKFISISEHCVPSPCPAHQTQEYIK